MSCPHPTTYMLCALGYSHLQLFHESKATMFLEIFKRITSHEDKELHLCGQWFPFFPKAFSSERLVNLPTIISPWHMQKNKCVPKLSFLCDEINQRVKYQWRVISSEATVGRARNEVLYWVCSWGQDCFSQVCMTLVKTQCPSLCSHIRLYFIFL